MLSGTAVFAAPVPRLRARAFGSRRKSEGRGRVGTAEVGQEEGVRQQRGCRALVSNVWHQRRAQRVRCMPGLGTRFEDGALAWDGWNALQAGTPRDGPGDVHGAAEVLAAQSALSLPGTDGQDTGRARDVGNGG